MEDNSNKNDKSHEVEVYYTPPEYTSKDIVVENPKRISQEEFNKM